MKIARSYFEEAAFNDEKSWERREGFEEGREEGREEGISIGEAQGIAIGKAEGKLEGKLEIAKGMLARGLSANLIYDLTGVNSLDLERLI